MATKKASPVGAGGKPAPATSRETPRAAAVQRPIAANPGADPRRLMREAAWARMFGRVESKNPFAG